MTRLEAEANRLNDPDEAYRLVIEAHRGLSDAASAALNARLVLILAHGIGDLAVLRDALRLAASTGRPDGQPNPGKAD